MNKLQSRMIPDAFFISPKGLIVEVSRKHIDAVIANPKRFGLSRKVILDAYEKSGEELGFEGIARDKLLSGLLRKGWIRVRINKQHCVCCQIGASAKIKYARNIRKLLVWLRQNLGNRKYERLSLRVYHHTADCWIINEFDMKGAVKALSERTR